MSAPILPVFSWEAIKASQAELGLREHRRPARVRVAIRRAKASKLAWAWPLLAALALRLDLWLARRT